jgi:hypothetical protein
MRNRNLRTAVERRNYGRHFDLHLYTVNDDGDMVAAAEPLTFRAAEANAECRPAVSLDRHQAQALADQLWEAGFRPTQGQQSEGQFGAMNAHLQDMRALVAATVKVELPTVPQRGTAA